MEKYTKNIDGIDFISNKKFNDDDKVCITGIFKGSEDGKFKSPKALTEHPNIIGGILNIGTKQNWYDTIFSKTNTFIFFKNKWIAEKDTLVLGNWKISFTSFFCKCYNNDYDNIYIETIKFLIEDKYGEIKEHKIT